MIGTGDRATLGRLGVPESLMGKTKTESVKHRNGLQIPCRLLVGGSAWRDPVQNEHCERDNTGPGDAR